MSKPRPRILTGDRPTGRLHLGHLVGSLRGRVDAQATHDTFILVADLHVLTTKPTAEGLADNVIQLVRDNLAAGLDPKRVTFFLQSAVPEIAELAVILGMFVTANRLQRIPTLKEVMHDLQIAQPSFGLLGYPVLMAADILSFQASVVPVGEDQLAHLELTRELARRFNQRIKKVFTEPRPQLAPVARLLGTDGQAKMSKSINNGIYLSDDAATVRRRVMAMYTDPNRKHATDPGKVEGNPVFQYHEAFNSDQKEVAELKERYRAGRVGDVKVKERLVAVLEEVLQPIRERAASFSDSDIKGILAQGTAAARPVAAATLAAVKEALRLTSL